MSHPDVLIIGAGPAGLSAAIELARLGLRSLLVEQRDQVGGAIYRGHADGHSATALTAHHRRRRDVLLQVLGEAGSRVTSALESVFLGVDRDGRCLIDNRRVGHVQGVLPKAVILAVGTVERVLPREGWELPGVVTAGGMQVQLKETGVPPQGPILLAGNGPLLLALGAQLAAAGNPPVAVLERARPLMTAWQQRRAVVDALRCWPNVKDAAYYVIQLLRAHVPYCSGWSLVSIRQTSTGLLVGSQHHSGVYREYLVQHLALHDGLLPNTTGLPAPMQSDQGCIVHAGDCREVLGAVAAIADGRRAAQQVVRHLGHACHDGQQDRAIDKVRRTQAAMAQLFQAPPIVPTAQTVICRCEGLRRTDFEHLLVAGSARELRLVGRFAMGVCQGRFCAETVSSLAHEHGIDFDPAALNGDVPRWPLRPVSLAALANYTELDPVL
ncbi:FAD-dependent oxidoreductase [Rhodoferax sp.]|uniref:FAD-dependent oxidoreductase n=1 Tax=Rhodoferax sp. TaxID=50421 RepID=UPI00284DEA94|nr:FAD-dependent oxidoreductase [Rhodoferax sp.]MDR3369320.1 FAD-dependent oxidoreductase [Rhodoferax sp.]